MTCLGYLLHTAVPKSVVTVTLLHNLSRMGLIPMGENKLCFELRITVPVLSRAILERFPFLRGQIGRHETPVSLEVTMNQRAMPA